MHKYVNGSFFVFRLNSNISQKRRGERWEANFKQRSAGREIAAGKIKPVPTIKGGEGILL